MTDETTNHDSSPADSHDDSVTDEDDSGESPTTETYTGVIDRIVDGEHVVLLLERDGQTVEQRGVSPEEIPPDGRHEGAVFEVRIEEGSVTELSYQPDTESERREAAQDRFDRLSKRLDEE